MQPFPVITRANLLPHVVVSVRPFLFAYIRFTAYTQEKELSTLPIRDALTIARMEDRERVSVRQLTSKMGLDMTNAAEVRQGCRHRDTCREQMSSEGLEARRMIPMSLPRSHLKP